MSVREYQRQMPLGGGLGTKLSARLHLDAPLLTALLLLVLGGLAVLYSAGGGDLNLVVRQSIRLGAGFLVLLVLAQIPPRSYRFWTPVIYAIGVILLALVVLVGTEAKGATRWLTLPGIGRFQPAELMKLAVPAMVAWFFSERNLPPNKLDVLAALGLIFLPVVMIAVQPDLGTSILIAAAGLVVLFMAGLSWRLISLAVLVLVIAAPLMYFFVLHDYQRSRVDTFLNPEADPRGAGWNIIQSKTAIGSGGVTGKGWLDGTQSRLDFLPESSTDFILAVLGEEFGLIGFVLLISIYLVIVGRGFFISWQAQETFSRLLAAALTMTFFIYIFVNVGMVSGLLPVVGVPLPLVSYGGTSIVTLMASFGMLMSIHTHRRLMTY
ncbi:MAG: rod shape-determining protein RodA [Alcanivorax sp.]|jgi:rod shape determining protein RodA|uniref:Peptidoglycan glycosyltransferase MrdB n=1 Tax=Alloalcanivorax venustensis ISO4 TaxID=1177184 RepID=A0ABS0AGK2_9GAMM|nr:rod shape-determining protein RodA [Alloalcanivorax venustensis]MAK21987.1 rod shape-determining protein RodA [Alcanivorax sp.]MEA3259289.1 rod shape-determining protein RodA [Pseudomonadota bacterium]SMO81682.1 cell elongation-specific peptidoglycan biosynthesis regulator RodA [Alcanivorax sp. DSM 26295]MAQ32623.1 rod shape-determining protein RodA [Alcanivorax sp.]MBA4731129.1 rod shape-determining protein RodA [Alcanivorax sp.]|tara:strand:- start:51995 stop:53134 length:1140 start_codon:yes stop_codon:yes gene_type:complete